MNMKVVLGVVLVGTLIVSSGIYGYTKITESFSKRDNVTLLDYTASKSSKKPVSFNLNSYTNKNSVGWLSDYEILIKTKKSNLENSDSTKEIMYLSIYNVDTGKTRDFKNVNKGKFISISPNKKYTIYEEPRRSNDELSDDEWMKDMKSEKLYNGNIKLLNLITGEITDLKTQYKNSEAEYEWINDDKLFIFYQMEDNLWEIRDLNGKVYKSGNIIKPQSNYNLYSVKILNPIVSEDKVTGTLIVNYLLPSTQETQDKDIDEYELLMVDINTNKEKSVYVSKGPISFAIQDNIVLIGEYCIPNSKLYYFDENGTKKAEYSLEGQIHTTSYSISRDDSKIAFSEQVEDSKNSPVSLTTNLNVLDLKSGQITKLFQSVSIIDNKSMNICWNNDGTAITFNVINKIFNINDTYLIRVQ